MKSLLDQEDTKQSPNFFSSKPSNISFEDDVSDGSSVLYTFRREDIHSFVSFQRTSINSDIA